LVTGLNQLVKGTAVDSFGITAIFISLATSLPELFVGVASALKGDSNLSLGVLMGSNISNISLMLGLAALVAGQLKAADKVFKKDILYTFLIGCLPLVLLLDKNLSRIDGAVLLIVYAIYNILTLTTKRKRRL